MIRCRILYQKKEELRYTGNLDLQKIWERFLRRAGLPIAYSQGFHPQPRIQQACPLPLGFLSTAELIDIFLEDDTLEPEQIGRLLQEMPYPGIGVLSIDVVSPTEPSLSSRVISSQIRAEFLDPVDDTNIQGRLNRLIASTSLPRTRRDKSYDLRPLIESIEIIPTRQDQPVALQMTLAACQGATGRPEEVVAELGLDPFAMRYIRTGILLDPQSA